MDGHGHFLILCMVMVIRWSCVYIGGGGGGGGGGGSGGGSGGDGGGG